MDQHNAETEDVTQSLSVTMDQHNDEKTEDVTQSHSATTDQPNAETEDVTQSHSDTTSDKKHMDVFERRKPLTFSPKRQYSLAIIAPLRKQDSSETVFAEVFSGTTSPAHSNRTSSPAPSNGTFEEIPRRRRARRRSLTRVQPFSFDESDSVRRVNRERRLREMRQMQAQQWSSSFKAHPVRRYKPYFRPVDRSRPVCLSNI